MRLRTNVRGVRRRVGPHMAMDHQYIDANAVAERYLGNRLRLKEREDFERHLVDCQECTDRILLAGMFHARLGNGAGAAHGATQATAHGAGALKGAGAFNAPSVFEDARAKTSEEPEPPPALFVRVKPLHLLWILLISAFLLVAIPALVWAIFEGYSGR
jgi:hypothetical protein